LPIGIEGDVRVLVNEEIVARSLSDHAKIIDARSRERKWTFRAELTLRHASPLVFISRRKALAADSHWLEVELAVKVSGTADSGLKEDVQVALHLDQLTDSSVRTWYEHD
jgi:hypothetical protein